MNAHCLGNRPAALAGVEALEGLGALMGGQLRLAAELHAVGPSELTAIVCALDDALTLVFGHGRQEGDEAAPQWRGEVEVRLVQHLDEGAAGIDALDQVDAVEH